MGTGIYLITESDERDGNILIHINNVIFTKSEAEKIKEKKEDKRYVENR